MRYATAMLMLSVLVGCHELKHPTPPLDPELRQEIFFRCLEALPAGPVETQYSDWDEVVNECAQQAYYMSIKRDSMGYPL